MKTCRITLCALAAVLCVGSASRAQDAAPATAPAPLSIALPADAAVDQTLDALDLVGRDLKTFTAQIRKSDFETTAQDTTVRTGKFVYQALGDGDSRLHITFDTRIQDGASQPQKLEHLVENGRWIERNYDKKIEATHQILRPGEKVNLIKLGEGPLPLPIGQKKEAVHKEFDVKGIEAAVDDPKNTVHLRLAPRPETQFERRFASIDVWVDQDSHMPVRIKTEDKHGSEVSTTDLSNVQRNVQLGDDDFKLPDLPANGWDRQDGPLK